MIIPLCIVNLGGYTWSASLEPGVTLLDLTSLSGCSLAASALFDLVFDDGIRPLYIGHHLAMLLATHGTTALIMTLPTNNKLRMLGIFQAYKVGLTWALIMRAQDSAPALPDQLRDLLLRHDLRGDYNGLSPAHKMGPAPHGRGRHHVFVPVTVHDNKVEDCGQAVQGVQQSQDRNEEAPPRE
ncbi:uncharacterized protein BDW70DRAFT_153472 [Aspergillus foveolatus]|uniref:uncharacterized protein n=1 Tax=Aspergillus foveolatus TaxID=210207 RepID=UPI003CCD2F0A